MPFIVIEGGDGSGKTTQSIKLAEYINSKNVSTRYLKFPNYPSKSGQVVRAMLDGFYGTDASKLNAYATSLMYTVDRYCSFNKEYAYAIEDNEFIIADRYTYSNMIHQGSKLMESFEAMDEFNRWLLDLEFDKIGLPIPDLTIYLYVDPKKQIELLNSRGIPLDINEQSEQVIRSTETAKRCANLYDWTIINCIDTNGNLFSIEDIFKKIIAVVIDKFPQYEWIFK